MKKILLSTALMVATAGVAAAEVTLSGGGRFGLNYNGAAVAPVSKTTISTRLRVNIDASVETESGVTFGGRIRLQHDSGSLGAALSPAQVFASYNGMRLEVGNASGAYDSAALMYNSEVGHIGRSHGNPNGSYYGFSSGPYAFAENNRMGVFFSYSMDSFNVRVSAIDGNQTLPATATTETELGLSADYTTGQFTVSAALNKDGLGIRGNDQFFIGAAYAFSDAGNVGLNFIDEGDLNGALAGDEGRTVVLYGNYSFGATTVRAYVANNNKVGNISNSAYGIGADYDLGGATLAGGVERGYNKKTRADLGVKFSF